MRLHSKRTFLCLIQLIGSSCAFNSSQDFRQELSHSPFEPAIVQQRDLTFLARSGYPVSKNKLPAGLVNVNLCPDGRHIIYGSGQLLTEFDLVSQTAIDIDLPAPVQAQVAVSPDHRTVALASWNENTGAILLQLFDFPAGRMQVLYSGVSEIRPGPDFVSWIPGSKDVIYKTGNHVIYRHNGEDVKLLEAIDASVSPDACQIAFKTDRHNLAIYSIPNRTVRTFDPQESDHCVWSPEGRFLLCRDVEKTFTCQAARLLVFVPLLRVRYDLVSPTTGTTETVFDQCGAALNRMDGLTEDSARAPVPAPVDNAVSISPWPSYKPRRVTE